MIKNQTVELNAYIKSANFISLYSEFGISFGTISVPEQYTYDNQIWRWSSWKEGVQIGKGEFTNASFGRKEYKSGIGRNTNYF